MSNNISPMKLFRFLFIALVILPGISFSQTFNPIVITGFNKDVIAESGTSSLTTTNFPIDGAVSSNKVIYTVGFKTQNSFGGGGIPDNGTITDAAGSYQLAAYTGNNTLLLQRGQTGDLTLATPAQFTKIRILCFSAEGSSTINATMYFTDGTSQSVVTNYTLADWFNSTTNVVIQGYGRCVRSTPTGPADSYPTNPRMYYIEAVLSCANRQKSLQRINFANNTTTGNNAPYPNSLFFAVSGVTNVINVTPSIINATCSANGSATLTITGSGSPYTISWNTVPVQTGATATNLAPGNYIATITDAAGCTSTSSVTIGLQNNLTLTTHADTSICLGASFNANTVSNATSYSWTPSAGVSNTAIANPVLSPTGSVQYTVTGTLGTCTISKSFIVAVNPAVSVNAGPDVTIIQGQSTQLQGSGTVGTYLWTPATALSATNILNPVATPLSTTTYTLRTTTSQGCTGTDDVIITVVPYCVKPMNAFTPNGDGINDLWIITNGPCLTKAKVNVYNRYGSEVYSSEDYKNNWDGTYKGKTLPDATYYYVIIYDLIDGRRIVARGDVTILR